MKINSIVFFIIITFTACQKSADIDKSFSIINSSKFEGNAVTIHNKQANAVSFSFKLNETFPLSMDMTIECIYSIAQKLDIDTPKAAWIYVIENNFPASPFSQNQWLHNEFIFSNSTASGFCDDLATYLVKLWQNLGYKARVIGLEGHVVAEVYHNYKWKLYDPDFRVYYTNNNKEIASLAELEKDSFLLSKPSQLYVSNITVNQKVRKQFNSFYLSDKNNSNNSEWSLADSSQLDSIFTLPSNSMFTIYYDSLLDFNLAKTSFSSQSKGILNIPLVPFCVEGLIKYTLNDSTLLLNPQNFAHFLDNYNQIDIVNTSSDAVIHYIINPYLSLFKQNNTISYKSTSKIDLNTSIATPPNCIKSLSFWQMNKKIDHLMEHQLVPYFEAVKNSTFNINSEEADFKHFSMYYANTKTYQDVLNLKYEIAKELKVSVVQLNQIIIDYYPLSTFLIYISLVDNNKSYLLEKIRSIPEN